MAQFHTDYAIKKASYKIFPRPSKSPPKHPARPIGEAAPKVEPPERFPSSGSERNRPHTLSLEVNRRVWIVIQVSIFEHKLGYAVYGPIRAITERSDT